MTVYYVQRFFAILFSVVTVLLGLLLTRLKWSRGVDFDPIGFFWLIENIGPLFVAFLSLCCAGLAVMFWIRTYETE
jgi:hypothetical protein